MKAISELRTSKRHYLEAPVWVEDNRTGYRYDGTMFNYSNSGMYLESEYAPRPGRKIRINVNKLPQPSAPRNYLAEIRWRQPLSRKASPWAYGTGVQFY